MASEKSRPFFLGLNVLTAALEICAYTVTLHFVVIWYALVAVD